MTAETLLDTLQAAGIRLAVNGDRLHVEAPPGRYNADLRARLLEHKADVVKLITMRDRLLGIARTVGVPADIVNRLPASELRACINQLPLWAGQFDEQGQPLQARVLVFYLRALAGMEVGPTGPPRRSEATRRVHQGATHNRTIRSTPQLDQENNHGTASRSQLIPASGHHPFCVR